MSSRAFLAPLINRQHFINGVPAEGYKIKVWQPDTQIASPIYDGTGVSGLTPLSQPVLINAWGFPATAIFLQRGTLHDIALTDPADVVVRVFENVAVGGDGVAASPTEWSGGTYSLFPLALEADDRTLDITFAEDIRSIVTPGRRVRVFGTGYTYGTVLSTYTEGVQALITFNKLGARVYLDTTISGAEFSALSSVEMGLLRSVENALPSRRYSLTTTALAGPAVIQKDQGLNLWPAGMMQQMSAAGVIPGGPAAAGYLQCNGQAVSRTTYSVLFAAIGTTFGVGDGSTTFNVPNRASENGMGWWIFAQA